VIFPKRLVVLTEQRQNKTLPANTDPADEKTFLASSQYLCPEVRIYCYRSVNMLPDSTLFTGIVPWTQSFLFYKKRLRHHSVKGIFDIRRNWRRHRLNNRSRPYVVIHDAWTENYYHWLTQALPRLIMVQQTGQPYTLLLPENHNQKFHSDSLALLGVKDWVVLPTGRLYYTIENLWYPGHDIQVGDLNYQLMAVLSEKLRCANGSNGSGRLFIHRTNVEQRKLVNENEVLTVFRSFGFRIVQLELLPFKEQICLLAGTSILAGVHGAGLANMMFMPRGSTVLELTTRIDIENLYYYSLSDVYQHRYYYQHCETDVRSTTIQVANLIVDISLLKHNLELILSNVGS
jgi:capsular polysaccharide biosynthesis protein